MTRQRTILFIDDDKRAVETHRRYLAERDFEVFHASNGEEALQMLRKTIPSVIVSEIMIGAVGGFEFCQRLRKNPEHFHLPFILLSKLRNVTKEAVGLQMGADLFLAKPISQRKLYDHILDLLNDTPAGTNDAGGNGATQVASFHGKLSEVPVAEVIQLIDRMGKSGRLTVSGNGQEGEIHFLEGFLADAQITGMELDHVEAFNALVFVESGEFTFDTSFTPPERKFKESTSTTILQAFVQRDHSLRDGDGGDEGAEQEVEDTEDPLSYMVEVFGDDGSIADMDKMLAETSEQSNGAAQATEAPNAEVSLQDVITGFMRKHPNLRTTIFFENKKVRIVSAEKNRAFDRHFKKHIKNHVESLQHRATSRSRSYGSYSNHQVFTGEFGGFVIRSFDDEPLAGVGLHFERIGENALTLSHELIKKLRAVRQPLGEESP